MPREDAVLKNKTLQALTRLGDRDTQRVAVKELERLAANADRAWRETLAIESLDRTRERAEARVEETRAGNARLEAVVAEAKKNRRGA